MVQDWVFLFERLEHVCLGRVGAATAADVLGGRQ